LISASADFPRLLRLDPRRLHDRQQPRLLAVPEGRYLGATKGAAIDPPSKVSNVRRLTETGNGMTSSLIWFA
jgi:hypothetical protein